jgi:Ca2+-binding RTX toxin-like protein
VAQINITQSEGANDSLVINTLGGDDTITATTLPAGVIKLTIDSGAGHDTVLGSQGADTFLAGDGNDFVFGDNGNDTAFMGAGDDVFQWNPGDGNDTIEGQDGTDEMLFFGANVDENINILANGGRALFLRDVATVTMDLDDVETIDFRAFGGADNIVVGDLSGTDVDQIDIDLSGPAVGGDGSADTVNQRHHCRSPGRVRRAQGVSVTGPGGDGEHVFPYVERSVDGQWLMATTSSTRRLEADGIQLTLNGGAGEDLFLGSEGDDLINGGDGNDVASGCRQRHVRLEPGRRRRHH